MKYVYLAGFIGCAICVVFSALTFDVFAGVGWTAAAVGQFSWFVQEL